MLAHRGAQIAQTSFSPAERSLQLEQPPIRERISRLRTAPDVTNALSKAKEADDTAPFRRSRSSRDQPLGMDGMNVEHDLAMQVTRRREWHETAPLRCRHVRTRSIKVDF